MPVLSLLDFYLIFILPFFVLNLVLITHRSILDMGKITNGIMGPVTGKVGPVVYSSWKGIPYVKSRPDRTKPPRKGEIANQDKFGMSQLWLKPLKIFVRQGFKGYTPTYEGFAGAKSYLSRNAFEEVTPGKFVINPALMQVSFGDLPLPDDISVGLVDGSYFQFTWDSSRIEGASQSDQVMLLAYDIENNDAYYTITGQFRKTGTDKLLISSRAGKNYHLYFALVAADRSRQSHSVYLGEISI